MQGIVGKLSVHLHFTVYLAPIPQRVVKSIFVVVPLVLESLAGWKLLTRSDLDTVKFFTAVRTFVAKLLPSVHSALKFDDHLAKCSPLSLFEPLSHSV